MTFRKDQGLRAVAGSGRRRRTSDGTGPGCGIGRHPAVLRQLDRIGNYAPGQKRESRRTGLADVYVAATGPRLSLVHRRRSALSSQVDLAAGGTSTASSGDGRRSRTGPTSSTATDQFAIYGKSRRVDRAPTATLGLGGGTFLESGGDRGRVPTDRSTRWTSEPRQRPECSILDGGSFRQLSFGAGLARLERHSMSTTTEPSMSSSGRDEVRVFNGADPDRHDRRDRSGAGDMRRRRRERR